MSLRICSYRKQFKADGKKYIEFRFKFVKEMVVNLKLSI